MWNVFWMNEVQMGQNAVGRWQVGGGLQVPSGPSRVRAVQMSIRRMDSPECKDKGVMQSEEGSRCKD